MKYVLKPRLINVATDLPRAAFIRNAALVLSVAASFKHGSMLNNFFFPEKGPKAGVAYNCDSKHSSKRRSYRSQPIAAVKKRGYRSDL